MKKLKVAVGIHGNIVFLENFPNDEEHGHLIDGDYLHEIESESDFDEKPGQYIAELGLISNGPDWNGDYDCYLDVIKLEPVNE